MSAADFVFPEPRNDAAIFGAPYAHRDLREIYSKIDQEHAIVREMEEKLLAEDRRMRAEVLPAPPEGYHWEAEIVWVDGAGTFAPSPTEDATFAYYSEQTAKIVYKLRPTP